MKVDLHENVLCDKVDSKVCFRSGLNESRRHGEEVVGKTSEDEHSFEKFKPAFVICSKRDRRMFKSSAACFVRTLARVALWKRLNFPDRPDIPNIRNN